MCLSIDLYAQFIWYQSLSGQGTSPPQISSWIIFLRKIAPSSTAPEVDNLPLNIPVNTQNVPRLQKVNPKGNNKNHFKKKLAFLSREGSLKYKF